MIEPQSLLAPHSFTIRDGSLRIVRRAQASDLEAICRIDRDANSSPWARSAYRDYLTAGADAPAILVCCRESAAEADAFAVASPLVDEFEILTIAVAPQEQRKGIGLIVMMTLLGMAESLGMTRWILEVREGNAAGRKLYSVCGFLETGRRPNYYADTGEAAILMAGQSPVPWEERQEKGCFRGVKLFNQ
ncbi:MAG TPA: GNAT family N-acetyltransferase [Clostridia bacterium]|nr:GNAT family N-acetyltransferase [Clostridia bacterium]